MNAKISKKVLNALCVIVSSIVAFIAGLVIIKKYAENVVKFFRRIKASYMANKAAVTKLLNSDIGHVFKGVKKNSIRCRHGPPNVIKSLENAGKLLTICFCDGTNVDIIGEDLEKLVSVSDAVQSYMGESLIICGSSKLKERLQEICENVVDKKEIQSALKSYCDYYDSA